MNAPTRVFPPQPGDLIRCTLGDAPTVGPWYERVDQEGHWTHEADKNVTSVLTRRAAQPSHFKAIPVNSTRGDVAHRWPPGVIVRVWYPNGISADALVYSDGTFYGQADVEAERAVAELAYEKPEDTYGAWISLTPTDQLEAIERAFTELVEHHDGDAVAVLEILSLVGSYEVHAHFRHWAALL